jgi:hypothetical protein
MVERRAVVVRSAVVGVPGSILVVGVTAGEPSVVAEPPVSVGAERVEALAAELL